MTASRRLLCPELIGRERQLDALDAVLDPSSRVQAALVGGEAGIGKSALLRRFVERIRERGGRALVGSCTEIEARRPFGPFIEILQQVAREPGSTWLGPALRGRLSPLLALAPDLAPNPPRGHEDGTDRFRIYDAVLSLLTDSKRSDARIAIVEDLHWADEASLELFAYLVRRLPAGSTSLVGSYRSDELHRTHPLNPVIAEIERARTADIIRLGPLDRHDSDRVVRLTLGTQTVPADLLETIAERCEGNTFFIEETLRSLVEEGHLRAEDGGWRWSRPLASAVPASVRDAVQLRVVRLSPATLRLLRVAAVIGQRFDLSLLERAAGSAEAEVLAALGEMVEAQLIDERTDLGTDVYMFRHALTRGSVLGELLQRERRELHARIGAAIESEAERGGHLEDRAEELAYHFDEAHDLARAHRYHELAGRRAAQFTFAPRRAIRHFERAIELGPADGVEVAVLYFHLAIACAGALDWRRGFDAAKRARDLYASAGDQLGTADAQLFMSFCLTWFGPSHESLGLLEEAIDLLRPLGPSLVLAEAHGNLAIRRLSEGETTAAIELARSAEAMSRESGADDDEHTRVRSIILSTLGIALAKAGMREGCDVAREALTFAEARGGQAAMHRAYSNLRLALTFTGAPYAERRSIFDAQLRHSQEHGYRNMFFIQAQLEHDLAEGAWDDALEHVSELSVTSGSRFEATAQLGASFIAVARRGPREGLPVAQAAVRSLLRIGSAVTAHEAGFAVLVHALAGDPAGALEIADLTREASGALGLPHEVVAASVLVAAASGDPELLERWLRTALDQERAVEPVVAKVRRAVARAEMALRDGRRDDGVRALGEAAEIFREEHMPHFETPVRLRRADLLVDAGDSKSAAAELRSVLPYWRKAKAEWYLRRLAHWARERGIPLETATVREPSRRQAGASLTAREREVAALVAEGLTNRQIAERLVISERTAETHVEQIRNKLGFRSRAQIAGWVAQRP